jgi:trimethylamine--corrinoid protein Co-methyltransferase
MTDHDEGRQAPRGGRSGGRGRGRGKRGSERRGGDQTKARAQARSRSGLHQLPWRQPVNPFPPLSPLDPEQLERVHQAALSILEERGIEFMGSDALERLAAGGAEVDRASGLVRFDRGLVEDCVAKAPSRFEITPRNPARRLVIGERHLAFALVSGPPNVSDLDRGRRAATFNDFLDLLRLGQSLETIHYVGNQPVPPTDLPAETRHLDCSLAAATLTDRCFSALAIGAERAIDTIEIMARSRGLSREQLAESPGVMTVINVNSPRRFDGAMTDGLTAMAEHGQPVIVTPFTLMGAMAPVTLAAALAQAHAEALSGLVLAQLVRPGAPVIYGGFTSNVDMKSGAPAFGTPEYTQACMAGGQLARRLGLPYRSSNVNASNCVDAQAAYESMMSLWGAIMGGANLINHAAGWLEGGLTASFEKVILDAELLQSMTGVLAPIPVDDDSLGLDAIEEVAPGGHYFGAAHTLARYETAFYAPLLSDWRNFETWQEAGELTATQRANGIWKQILADFQAPPLAEDRRESMEAYVARRKEEITRTAA